MGTAFQTEELSTATCPSSYWLYLEFLSLLFAEITHRISPVPKKEFESIHYMVTVCCRWCRWKSTVEITVPLNTVSLEISENPPCKSPGVLAGPVTSLWVLFQLSLRGISLRTAQKMIFPAVSLGMGEKCKQRMRNFDPPVFISMGWSWRLESGLCREDTGH